MKRLLFLFILLSAIAGCDAQCNGYSFLCDRKYNEVAYLTTHNAFNSEADGFLMPNQNNSITQQLNDGVRGFMIDVYDVSGVPTVYHGLAILGSKPLSYNLGEIKSFLDNNPNEIVTIIFECHVTANAIETALDDAGLLASCFAKDTLTQWPTLQEMIDVGKRLVIFSEADNGSTSQPWYHYVWDYAVETHFTVNDSGQFNCDYNRGDSLNDLFILNHFVTNDIIGTGSETDAAIVNANPFFINRIKECMTAKNKFANFLTVDFYELGNTFDALNTINNMDWYSFPDQHFVKEEILIWTDYTTKQIHIEIVNDENFDKSKLVITNLLGLKVFEQTINEKSSTINFSQNRWKGFYFVSIYSTKGNFLRNSEIIVLP